MSGTFININSGSTNGTFQTLAVGGFTVTAGNILDIQGIGALGFPVLTTAQRDSLTPKNGSMIYNSDNVRFETYLGNNWSVAAVFFHQDLGGLSSDDHLQYVKGSGRSGGQTVAGDTASGGNITISSTAHATKGNIVMDGTIKNNLSANETAAVSGTAPVTEYLKVVKSNGSVRYIPLVTTPN